MTEMKAQLLTDLPYHRIEQPRKQNKYLAFFGAYVALPLMSVILVLSLLVLFLLIKTYFTNSYIYIKSDNFINSNTDVNIGPSVDKMFEQFKKPKLPAFIPKSNGSLIEKALSLRN